jgi:hypothetical protein
VCVNEFDFSSPLVHGGCVSPSRLAHSLDAFQMQFELMNFFFLVQMGVFLFPFLGGRTAANIKRAIPLIDHPLPPYRECSHPQSTTSIPRAVTIVPIQGPAHAYSQGVFAFWVVDGPVAQRGLDACARSPRFFVERRYPFPLPRVFIQRKAMNIASGGFFFLFS